MAQHVLPGLHLTGEVRRQELHLVVGLQVGRVVGHDGIGRAVGFVEAVTGELLDVVEDLPGLLVVDLVLCRARQELGPLLLHDLDLLLAHGAAQQVRLPQRIARQDRGALHDLLLIQNDAVCLLQHPLQHGVRVLRPGLAVLALDVLVHHAAVQRAGPVHGQRGDQVLEAVDLQLAEHAPYPVGFQLEDPHGVRLLKELVGGGVVRGDLVQDRRRLAVEADVLQRLLQDGKRAQAQEVHLHQAQLLHRLHGELRHGLGHVQLALRHRRAGGLDLPDGHEVRDGHRGDDHARRVLRGMTRQALDVLRHVQDLFNAAVFLGDLLQLRRPLQGFPDALGVGGDELRHLVHQRVLDARGAPHVLHRLAALHPPKGDDLGHTVAAVPLDDVLQKLFAPLVGHVRVDIRHADALRVQETLEQQIVPQRVQLRDTEAPRHQRPRRGTTPRPDGDMPLLRRLDDAADDQEIRGEPHLGDDAQLVLQPLAILLRRVLRLEAHLQPGAGLLLKVAVQRHALGQLQAGQHVMPRLELQLDVAALRDGRGVIQRLRHLLAKGRVHLLRRPEEEIIGRKTEGVVRLVGVGVDAEQDLVPVVIFLVEIMRVGRGDQGDARVLRHFDQRPVHPGLLGEGVGHDLKEEIPLAHDVLIKQSAFGGLVLLALQDKLRDLPRQARGRGDEAPGVAGQEVVVDARLIVKPVGVGDGDDLHQVVIPLLRLGEEEQVVVLAFLFSGAVAVRVNVGLAPQDGLHALGAAVLVELHNAVHDPVIGHGHRLVARLLLAPARHLFGQVLGADGAVQQAVLRVDVQMNKGSRHLSLTPLFAALLRGGVPVPAAGLLFPVTDEDDLAPHHPGNILHQRPKGQPGPGGLGIFLSHGPGFLAALLGRGRETRRPLFRDRRLLIGLFLNLCLGLGRQLSGAGKGVLTVTQKDPFMPRQHTDQPRAVPLQAQRLVIVAAPHVQEQIPLRLQEGGIQQAAVQREVRLLHLGQELRGRLPGNGLPVQHGGRRRLGRFLCTGG